MKLQHLRWLALGLLATSAQAIDLDALWDFRNPALSEQRFRAALAGASSDEALILQTQIARTHGLRREFEKAREVLAAIEPQLTGAGAEARCRHALELGRSLASATHRPEQRTPQSDAAARAAFERALAIASGARLDALAIDAIHMFAFIDTAPERQRHWAQEALAVSLASDQPAARRWEASIRNNLGVALNGLKRHEEALSEFQQALVLRERQGANPHSIRVAHWMVAHTLRLLGRGDEALAIQQRLERENESAGTPDRYVFEELEALHRARGDTERAEHYAARRKAAAGS